MDKVQQTNSSILCNKDFAYEYIRLAFQHIKRLLLIEHRLAFQHIKWKCIVIVPLVSAYGIE